MKDNAHVKIDGTKLSVATVITLMASMDKLAEIKPQRCLFLSIEWYRKARKEAIAGSNQLTIKSGKLYWMGELVRRYPKWPES